MGDIHDAMRDVLRRRAEGVTPLPLGAGVLRRLRFRQTGVVLLTSLILGGAIVGSLYAMRALTSAARSDLASPAAGGPLARSVYVATPGAAFYESSVHMIRTGSRGPQTVRTFPARGAPALAVSPDRTRLYVVSGYGREGQATEELVAFDVTSGEEVMKAALRPEEALYRVASGSPSCCPTMAVSPDGRWLFLLWVTGGDEGERTFYVGTFDTVEGALLPEMMPLEGCEPGIQALIPLTEARSLAVVCEASSDVRFLEASDSGGLRASARLPLPVAADAKTDSFGNEFQLGRLAWAVASADSSSLYVVTLNGHVFVVDLSNRSIVAETSVDIGLDRHVAYGQVGLSDSGEKMYLGVGPISDGFDLISATHVLEVDTETWSPTNAIDLAGRFQSMVVTGGEGEVYVSGDKGLSRVAVDDAKVTSVPSLGQRPESIVAP
jgi:hypothetical protein